MIAASRRRRDALSRDDALRLHVRLARRAAVDRRLANASLGALGASLVGLVFAPSVSWHAALTLVGAVLGALLPTPDSMQRAFASIRSQAGLSYETALELRAARVGDDGSGAADPFGLAARVEERAHLSVRDVKPTSPPAWWVPLMLVAFGLLLIPGLAPAGAAGVNGGLGPSPQQQDAAVAGAEPSEDDDDAMAANQQLGRLNEPDGADDDAQGAIPEAGADRSGAADDQQAPLSRFLQNLRERPADVAGGSSQESTGEGADDQGESSGGNPLAEGEADPRRFEVGDGSDDGERETVAGSGEGDPGGEGPRGADAGDEQDGQDGEQEGDDGQRAGDRNPFEQAGGSSEPDSEAQELGGGEGPEGGDGFAAAPDEGGDGGADGVAGEGSGAFGEGGEVGADAAGDSELLRGVLSDGPESSLGTVLLPGRDEVELPEGLAYAPYAAAAEEAMSEGDLPLEYQEIIRRYFQ